MRRQQSRPQHFRAVTRVGIGDGDDIATRFWHFFVIHRDKTVMQPIFGHMAGAMRTAALRNLVFMMRKNQIKSASVNIKHLAKIGFCHGRTFNMPSRPAASPWAVPSRLAGGAGFPQDKVFGCAFIGRDLNPRTGDHIFHATLWQRAIMRHCRHLKQHMPISGIGMTLINQQRYHRNHLVNMMCCTRLHIWRHSTQRSGISVKTDDGICT